MLISIFNKMNVGLKKVIFISVLITVLTQVGYGQTVECPGSTVTYTVQADMSYNGIGADYTGDTFLWEVYGGSITGGTSSGTPTSSTITTALGAGNSSSIEVTWDNADMTGAYIKVTQVSGVGCSGNTQTMNIELGDVEAPIITQTFANVEDCALVEADQSFTLANLGLDRSVDTTQLTDNCTAPGSLTIEYEVVANINGTQGGDGPVITPWTTANDLNNYTFSYSALKAVSSTAIHFHVYYRITDSHGNSTQANFYVTVDPVPTPGNIIPD